MHENGFFDEIDRFLSPYNTKQLSSKQLKFYTRSYMAGWEQATEYLHKGKNLSLRILFKSDNRYILPDVAVFPDVLDVLDFPHVEKSSRLCVWDSVVCCNHAELHFLKELFIDAYILLGKLLSGECTEDFRNGFLSYWEYKVADGFKGISLCDPNYLQARQVYLYKSKQFGLVFGETEDQIRTWLKNYYNFPKDKNRQSRKQQHQLSQIAPTALFFFNNAWLPDNYPSSVEELRQLVVPNMINDDEFAKLIADALNNLRHNQLGVLIALQTQNGVCFAGLSFAKGLFPQKNRFAKNTILDGFREQIPAKHLLHRTSTIKTLGISVSRADTEWVHGRGETPHLADIQSIKIMIVGCGSVGSGVAKLLVKSGITKLILVDSESIEFANISRHELGALYVGKNKATSLQAELQRSFPHTEITPFEDKWQNALNGTQSDELKTQAEEADLIVSATADWGSDLGLIAIQEELALNPIIFAYTEAHAVASHVIVHPDGSDAYQNTHNMEGSDVGAMKVSCSTWEAQTRIRLPVCGGAFQPYGAAALSYLHTMTVETILNLITEIEEIKALRKIWLGDSALLKAAGGQWNPEWIDLYGDPGKGNLAVKLHLLDDGWEQNLD